MTLARESRWLVISVAVALAVQVPMLPGMGLESRDLSSFAPWMTTISMLLFFPLLGLALLALAIAWTRPTLAAALALAFVIGMIPITLVDMLGLGGSSPPAVILALEAVALVTFLVTLLVAALAMAHFRHLVIKGAPPQAA